MSIVTIIASHIKKKYNADVQISEDLLAFLEFSNFYTEIKYHPSSRNIWITIVYFNTPNDDFYYTFESRFTFNINRHSSDEIISYIDSEINKMRSIALLKEI